MADFKILCPACASILSSKKPIPNGKKITCPHCHKPFVAATSERTTSSDSSSLEFDVGAPTAPTGHAPPRPEAPKPREKSIHVATRNAPPKSSRRRVVLGSVMIGLVVLAGAGGAAGMYYYLQLPETSLAQKLKGSKGSDPKTEQPEKSDGKTAGAARKPKGEPKKGGAAKGDDDRQSIAQAAKPDAPVSAVTPPAKPKAADWKEFKSAKGGFAVQFPAKPAELQEREEDLIFYTTKSELNGFEYEVTFHRLKKDDLTTPAKDRLGKIAAEFKDTTKELKEVDLEGLPKNSVIELTRWRNNKKDLAIERWLVHKEHVFQIGVCGDKAKLGPDQVSRFMESFRFVADPQGDFLDLTKTTGIPPERKKK